MDDPRETPENTDALSRTGESVSCDVLARLLEGRRRRAFLTADTVDRELPLLIDSALAWDRWKLESCSTRGDAVKGSSGFWVRSPFQPGDAKNTHTS